MRQAPKGRRRLFWQSVGILIPAFSAAPRIIVPGGTETGTPSIVRFTILSSLAISNLLYSKFFTAEPAEIAELNQSKANQK
jgi:hypothetical protein